MAFNFFAFVGGILSLQIVASLPERPWAYLLLAGLFLVFQLRVVSGFLLGFYWAATYSQWVLNDRLPSNLEGKDTMIVGVIEGLPQTFDKGVRFVFETENTDDEKESRVPGRLRLSWYYPTVKVKAGQKWRFLVRLKIPHGSLNPGGFDYEKWIFLQRIGATGYVRNAKAPVLLGQEKVSIQAFRQQLDETLSLNLINPDLVGLIKALSIGSRSEITSDQWKILRQTGTAHLVAISGLHVGLMAGLSFMFFRWLAAWCPFQVISPRVIAAFLCLICAFVYAMVAGFSLPTQRAMVMITVAVGGIIFRRNIRPLSVLGLALVSALIFDPSAVLSQGFWLSFCAVFLIIFVGSSRLDYPNFWIRVLKVHFVTAFGLAPLLFLFFQKASLIAPIANLIAVPVVSLIIVPLLLSAILCLLAVPSFGVLLLGIAEKALSTLWVFLQALSDVSFSAWVHPLQDSGLALLGIFAVLLIFSPRGIPGRWLGAVLLLPFFFVDYQRPDQSEITLAVLDVGQGLSAVVQTANHVLVYDAGARFSERFDMGASVVVPYLRTVGVRSIDALVVSHGDNDHIGGARSLGNEFLIDALYSSVPEKIDWHSALECRAGSAWEWDGVEFRILSPFGTTKMNENDSSCVLQIVSAGGTVLLPGDIEKTAERLLISRYGKQLQSTVLIVPHHGSNTSSTESFLALVKAEYALISAGYRNRFGFPRPEVLQRLARHDCQVFTTSEAGAVMIHIDAQSGTGKPQSFRLTNRRYWNR